MRENIKEETALLTVLGNHEFINYRDKDAPGSSGGFWMVEADEQGRVRMRLYDIEKCI